MQSLQALWTAAVPDQVPHHLEYPAGTMVDEFDRATAEFADLPALDFFGQQMTYADLREAAYTVAGNLAARGVGPGRQVALLMPTCPQHVIAFYGVLLAGGTVVEHNPLSTVSELTPMFADHLADVAIVWDAAAHLVANLPASIRPTHVISINMIDAMPLAKRLLLKLPISKARESRAALSKPAPGTTPWSELLKHAPAPAPSVRPANDDVALVLYTSGTTGVAKGVPLTHRNLTANAVQSTAWVYDIELGTEVFLACLPIFHVFGCSLSMNLPLRIGALIHLVPKPEASLILDAYKRKVPTIVIAVPPVFEKVADAAREQGVSLRGSRVGISGAMPLPASLIEKWEAATGGLLIEGYGLSETGPVIAGNPVNRTRKAGHVGVPFPDTEMRLADPEDPSREVPDGERGEILVKGPQVFSGYRNRPEDTERAFWDGWFRTGDIAEPDENGFLRIVDRIKEMVITGGFNVYPSEVEEVLRGEAGIRDAAVVGLVNELGAEEVVAAVVLHEGQHVDIDEVRARIRERLSAYKVPRKVFVLPELPRNPMGKVLRREVRDAVEKLRADGAEFAGRVRSGELADKVRADAEVFADKVRLDSADLVDRMKSDAGDFADKVRAERDVLAERVRGEAEILADRVSQRRAALSGTVAAEEPDDAVDGEAEPEAPGETEPEAPGDTETRIPEAPEPEPVSEPEVPEDHEPALDDEGRPRA